MFLVMMRRYDTDNMQDIDTISFVFDHFLIAGVITSNHGNKYIIFHPTTPVFQQIWENQSSKLDQNITWYLKNILIANLWSF